MPPKKKPPRQRKRPSPTVNPQPDSDLSLPVTSCRGVGPGIARLLSRLDIATVRDLLHHFPRAYLDRRTVVPIKSVEKSRSAVIVGEVVTVRAWRPRRRFHITQCRVRDGTGCITAVWFNQPYLRKSVSRGKRVILSGMVSLRNGLQLENPDIEIVDDRKDVSLHTMGIIPVYPLTEGLGHKTMRRLVRAALDDFLKLVPETLPDRMLQSHRLLSMRDAMLSLHFPENESKLEAARRTMIFEEFAALQLNLLRARARSAAEGIAFTASPKLTAALNERLPFPLTYSQHTAIDEIFLCMESPARMNVLLQGDVGSGKTIVAVQAMLKAVDNDRQAALMAPTEILAEQHCTHIRSLLDGLGVRTCLLTAGRPAQERRDTLKQIASGQPCIIVGTHALIGENVSIPNLGLVIVDEQHRFGVNQRAALPAKGITPDLIVMTATPIPRTLALMLYADFKIVLLAERPAGRSPVETACVTESERPGIVDFANEQIKQGRQIFVVCPEIGETSSELSEGPVTVRKAFALYSKWFRNWSVGCVHGRMVMEERENIFKKFRANRLQVLISTTLIEVGIDVPNASVIIIESAERFGLSQLHQLRGRVGRAEHQSYCFLFSNPFIPQAVERLGIFASVTDGFQIAEQDLLMRGPGEFLGAAQSGIPKLRVGHLLRDNQLLHEAREAVATVLETDPHLASVENAPLRSLIDEGTQDVHL